VYSSRVKWRVGVAALAVAGLLGGCGESGYSQEELDRARDDAAKQARQEAKIERLEQEVKELKKTGSADAKRSRSRGKEAPREASTPVSVTSDGGGVRAFHTPSGNVACELTMSSAVCSIASEGITFRLVDGARAVIESGISVPRTSGQSVGYGSTISAGSVQCSVPPSDVPRGVTCRDIRTGHGFEASRHAERQKVF
jgi:hypothetical protein